MHLQVVYVGGGYVFNKSAPNNDQFAPAGLIDWTLMKGG